MSSGMPAASRSASFRSASSRFGCPACSSTSLRSTSASARDRAAVSCWSSSRPRARTRSSSPAARWSRAASSTRRVRWSGSPEVLRARRALPAPPRRSARHGPVQRRRPRPDAARRADPVPRRQRQMSRPLDGILDQPGQPTVNATPLLRRSILVQDGAKQGMGETHALVVEARRRPRPSRAPAHARHPASRVRVSSPSAPPQMPRRGGSRVTRREALPVDRVVAPRACREPGTAHRARASRRRVPTRGPAPMRRRDSARQLVGAQERRSRERTPQALPNQSVDRTKAKRSDS